MITVGATSNICICGILSSGTSPFCEESAEVIFSTIATLHYGVTINRISCDLSYAIYRHELNGFCVVSVCILCLSNQVQQ